MLDQALRAQDDVIANNDVAACKALQAFIGLVTHQRGKNISEADADALIADTQEIIGLLSSVL
ncbi:MAG: hypothetical protein V3U33_08975 [candidate division NC10 bacterium]